METSRSKIPCRMWFAVALAAAVAGFTIQNRSIAQQEELDPLKLAPDTQKLVFENALVRVTEERLPPGRGLPKHRHGRGLTIAMADYTMEQKIYPSGQIVHADRHVGEINWTDGLIHEARNAGNTHQYVVRIELK